eukprot:3173647-Amphidinium_carterae.1
MTFTLHNSFPADSTNYHPCYNHRNLGRAADDHPFIIHAVQCKGWLSVPLQFHKHHLWVHHCRHLPLLRSTTSVGLSLSSTQRPSCLL